MKKIFSNIILIIVTAVCSFLLISNIMHIIYLNQTETYNFNNTTITNMKKHLTALETNINAINTLDNTVYNEEDLRIIKDTFQTTLKELQDNKLLQYEGIKYFHAKDLLALDLNSQISASSNVKMIKTLAKYDESINNYLELYTYDFVSSAYNRDAVFQKALQAYKYVMPDFFNTNMYEPINSGIISRIYTLDYNIIKQNYMANLVLEIGGANNE